MDSVQKKNSNTFLIFTTFLHGAHHQYSVQARQVSTPTGLVLIHISTAFQWIFTLLL